MQVTTKAIVFSSIKYAESHLIVTCFTEGYGLKSYLIRGVLKSKKGKFSASLFQPLTLLQLNAIHKNKGSLERLQEAKIITHYQTLHTHVLKTSVVFFLAEILKTSVKEEEANVNLFQFLEQSFLWFDQQESTSNFHILFLLNLCEYLGFYPDFSNKNLEYFNLLEGVFQTQKNSEYCEKGNGVNTLIKISQHNYLSLHQLSINKADKKDLLQLLLRYYSIHLQGFKIPKSLPVLSQLFH